MALATRCPHCATTFRVAHDQLKLRAGLVRCGACKQIFNGVENLLGPELPAPAKPSGMPVPRPPVPPPAPSATPPSPPPSPDSAAAVRPPSPPGTGMPASAGSASPDSLRLSPPTTAFPSSTRALPADEEAGKDTDPLTRMTLMDFTFIEEGSA